MRLVYDSFLPGRQEAGASPLGELSESDGGYLLSFDSLRYADGHIVTSDMWISSIAATLHTHYPDTTVKRHHSNPVITGISRNALDDFLRSAFAIPFREPDGQLMALDSHPCTSGKFQLLSADSTSMTLIPNPTHPKRPQLRQFTIVHITDPIELRSRFAAGEVDVIVVAGDESDILNGEVADLRNGQVRQTLSNSVSILSARPHGKLADDGLRHSIANALPREEYQKRFLHAAGVAVTAFTAEALNTPLKSGPERIQHKGKSPSIAFIVPPSERTVARARWISAQIYDRTGIRLDVKTPSWPDYFEAIRDPAGGDLLWMGINVDIDKPEQWVRDCLFGPWLPIPDTYHALRSQVMSSQCRDADLITAERALLSDCWIMPLYRHYQTYLVRNGLSGLRVDPGDWPIPGVHYAEQLSWG